MATDLTWQQIADKLPAGAVTALAAGASVPSAGVYINAAALTGDAILSMGANGVVEFCVKLLQAANKAQELVNTNATSGDRLAAFPVAGATVPTADADTGIYYTNMTCQVTGKLPINGDNITGPVR